MGSGPFFFVVMRWKKADAEFPSQDEMHTAIGKGDLILEEDDQGPLLSRWVNGVTFVEGGVRMVSYGTAAALTGSGILADPEGDWVG